MPTRADIRQANGGPVCHLPPSTGPEASLPWNAWDHRPSQMIACVDARRALGWVGGARGHRNRPSNLAGRRSWELLPDVRPVSAREACVSAPASIRGRRRTDTALLLVLAFSILGRACERELRSPASNPKPSTAAREHSGSTDSAPTASGPVPQPSGPSPADEPATSRVQGGVANARCSSSLYSPARRRCARAKRPPVTAHTTESAAPMSIALAGCCANASMPVLTHPLMASPPR
jgi:hypothetical protein